MTMSQPSNHGNQPSDSSPSGGNQTPILGGRQMSAALREKLKRSGRIYKSPLLGSSNSAASTGRLIHSALTACKDEPQMPVRQLADADFMEDDLDSSSDHTLKGNGGSRDIFPPSQNMPGPCIKDHSANCGNKSKDNSPLFHNSDDKSANRSCKRSLSCVDRRNDNVPLSEVTCLEMSSSGHAEETCKKLKVDIDYKKVPPSSSFRPVLCQSKEKDCAKTEALEIMQSPYSSHAKDDNKSCDNLSPNSLNNQSISELKEEKAQLMTRIAQKEERLRKLKMVKMYRTKNDLQQLQELITRWRQVSQEALEEIVTVAPEPKPSLTEIVNHFQLDHELLGFCAEDESFQ